MNKSLDSAPVRPFYGFILCRLLKGGGPEAVLEGMGRLER